MKNIQEEVNNKIMTEIRSGDIQDQEQKWGEIEGCPDCGSTDIYDEGVRCAECAGAYAEFRYDERRENDIIKSVDK